MGRLRERTKAKFLHESFIIEGFNAIKVKYLGDNLVLLNGLEGADVQ